MTETPKDFLLEPASWSVDEAALKYIRHLVFIEEQGFTEDEEWDDLDPGATHMLATTMQGSPIGTGRVTADRQLGRIAVLKAWRGNGVGRALMSALEEGARSRGMEQISLGAQTQAVGFYERLGYALGGEPYTDGGIAHRWMSKTLDAPGGEVQPRMGVRNRAVVELEADTCVIESQAQLSARYEEVIESTRRTLDIYTRDLEPRALDRDPVVDGLIKLATSGRGRKVRLLVEDTLTALDRGHRIIDLSQRLSTVISIRVPSPADRGYLGAYAVADGQHVIHRENATRPGGQWLPHQPRRARQLLMHFNEVWEHALPEPHFQYLGL